MKVLIVDDCRIMRMLVRRTLRRSEMGEHEVVEAESASEAIERLKSFRADLILTDLQMPEQDGLEMLRAIRKSGNDHVRVGFVTAQAAVQTQDRLRVAGADFVITKPFTSEDFARALERYVVAA